jgi:integrase
MASIQKRQEGVWRARYRDEHGREHARHFARKADAQRWLDETTAAIVSGQYVDPRAGKVTFRAFYESWAPNQIWAPNTKKAMDLAAGSVSFAGTPLKALRRSHVEAWVKAMTANGLAASTVKTRYTNVRSVLRAAVLDRVIASDPSQGVTLPRRRRAEAAVRMPTPDEVRSLLACADPLWRPLFTVTALAGLRSGEVAALRVGDVDFLRHTIRVERQVQRLAGGRVELRPPKFGSERTVYIPTSLTSILAAHLSGRPDARGATQWLFGQGGDPPHQNTVGHQWRRACAKAGVEGATLHSMRHFYASGLIADGCDVVTVQRALGHASAAVTLKTYAHLWPTAEDRTRNAAEGLAIAVLDGDRGASSLRIAP